MARGIGPGGADHTVALWLAIGTDTGELLTWGSGGDGELGDGEPEAGEALESEYIEESAQNTGIARAAGYCNITYHFWPAKRRAYSARHGAVPAFGGVIYFNSSHEPKEKVRHKSIPGH